MLLTVLLTLFGSGLLLFTLIMAFGAGVHSHEKTVVKAGGTGLQGVKLLRDINKVADDMLNPTNIVSMCTFLCPEDRDRLIAWQTAYEKHVERSG